MTVVELSKRETLNGLERQPSCWALPVSLCAVYMCVLRYLNWINIGLFD